MKDIPEHHLVKPYEKPTLTRFVRTDRMTLIVRDLKEQLVTVATTVRELDDEIKCRKGRVVQIEAENAELYGGWP